VIWPPRCARRVRWVRARGVRRHCLGVRRVGHLQAAGADRLKNVGEEKFQVKRVDKLKDRVRQTRDPERPARTARVASSGIPQVCEQLHSGEVARIHVDVTDSPRNQSPSALRTAGSKLQAVSPGVVMPQIPKVTEKKSTTCRISSTWSVAESILIVVCGPSRPTRDSL
jgi:hypothetical protein